MIVCNLIVFNAIPLYKWLTANTKFAGFSGPMSLILSPIVKKMDEVSSTLTHTVVQNHVLSHHTQTLML
ncbi:MAG: hypothetical protein MJ108_04035 [Saccharofermentans sp.]|nr:hypothetical protein [Saccharofermentans sp.]